MKLPEVIDLLYLDFEKEQHSKYMTCIDKTQYESVFNHLVKTKTLRHIIYTIIEQDYKLAKKDK